MQREAIEEAKRWTDQAKADLHAAKYNVEGGIFYLACFLSQQAAEKAMKAFFYAHGEEFVFGHSVMELCKRAAPLEEIFSKYFLAAGKLDRFYIPTRYPNGLPGGIPAESFGKEDAMDAIKIAEEIMITVEDVIYILESDK